jgi:hypothetical protein
MSPRRTPPVPTTNVAIDTLRLLDWALAICEGDAALAFRFVQGWLSAAKERPT